MAQFTIKDIARKLGVSASTVSRALHDHPDISDETKRRVQEMADRYEYRPNQIAKSLQNRRSNIIGVVVPEIRHDFFSSAISGIEEVAYEAGYAIMVCQSHELFSREVLTVQALASQRVAGILVSLSRETDAFDHLKAAMRHGITVVQFDRVTDELETGAVVVDDEHGAYTATNHLIEKGYIRIGHIGGAQNIAIGRERYRGYCRALREHGFDVRDELVRFGGYHEEDGRGSMNELLELVQPPDAVFAVNDPVAIGAYSCLRDKGISIPSGIALVGFSGNPVTALVEPPLTTIRQPAHSMGKRAAQLILERIDSGEKGRHMETLQTRLIVRRST